MLGLLLGSRAARGTPRLSLRSVLVAILRIKLRAAKPLLPPKCHDATGECAHVESRKNHRQTPEAAAGMVEHSCEARM